MQWTAGRMVSRGDIPTHSPCRSSRGTHLLVLCRIAQIGVIQLDTTPTERILYSLCRAESGVRPCTEIGANGQPDKALLDGSARFSPACAPRRPPRRA